jgi:tRNA(Arg) A34 adenosine deaminase TadA
MQAPFTRDPKYQAKQASYEDKGVPAAVGKRRHARCRLSHCVVACLVRGGKVLTPTFAMCSEASPRLRPHVARLLGGQQPRSLTQHAEIAALNMLPEGISARQLRHTTLVVIRPKYSQKLRQTRMLCALPCSECAQIIHQLGIKLVVYSSEDTLHRRKPCELLTESLPSSGTEWLMRS